jgi:hypothetical protein
LVGFEETEKDAGSKRLQLLIRNLLLRRTKDKIMAGSETALVIIPTPKQLFFVSEVTNIFFFEELFMCIKPSCPRKKGVLTLKFCRYRKKREKNI